MLLQRVVLVGCCLLQCLAAYYSALPRHRRVAGLTNGTLNENDPQHLPDAVIYFSSCHVWPAPPALEFVGCCMVAVKCCSLLQQFISGFFFIAEIKLKKKFC